MAFWEFYGSLLGCILKFRDFTFWNFNLISVKRMVPISQRFCRLLNNTKLLISYDIFCHHCSLPVSSYFSYVLFDQRERILSLSSSSFLNDRNLINTHCFVPARVFFGLKNFFSNNFLFSQMQFFSMKIKRFVDSFFSNEVVGI